MSHDPRLAGQVRRWHTWPMLQHETNAEHQWHTARILLAIYPACDRQLIIDALLHDCGEIATGDILGTAKERSPDLRATAEALEQAANLSMMIPWGLPRTRTRDQRQEVENWVLKLAEVIQTWEFAKQEVAMGNRLAQEVADHNMRRYTRMSSEFFADPMSAYHEIVEAAEMYVRRREKTWA